MIPALALFVSEGALRGAALVCLVLSWLLPASWSETWFALWRLRRRARRRAADARAERLALPRGPR